MSVQLQCFEGYTQFAVWPVEQEVNTIYSIIFFQILAAGCVLLWITGYRDDSLPCSYWPDTATPLLSIFSLRGLQSKGWTKGIEADDNMLHILK